MSPHYKAGRIVGTGGSYVKHIEQVTGAKKVNFQGSSFSRFCSQLTMFQVIKMTNPASSRFTFMSALRMNSL